METGGTFFGHRDAAYVWRKQGEAYNPKNTVYTMKYGLGSIMLYARFSTSGTGNLINVVGIMKKGHVTILKENLNQSAAKLDLYRRFVLQYDNDPKHSLLLVKNDPQITKVNVTDLPAQSIRPRFMSEDQQIWRGF